MDTVKDKSKLNNIISISTSIMNSAWKFFAGCIITIIAFTTFFTDWKRPSINVEITEVSNSISEKIDLELRPELSEVAKVLDIASESTRTGIIQNFNLADIERSLKVKEKEANEYESNALKFEKQLNNINREEIKNTEKLAKIKEAEYFEVVSPGIFFSILNEQENQETETSQEDLELNAMKIVERIQNNISGKIKRIQSKQDTLQKAYSQLKLFKEAAYNAEARLYVTAAIGNEGAGATSLRPQALLRANLGDGNYLDINLKMVDYPLNSELPPQSFRVIKFSSDELRSMPSLDQDRFRNLFNNISPTNLYITDVRGRVMKSNTIPFSQGIYEQKVFDTLKSHASSGTSQNAN